jgi:hypothetical protein
LKVVHALQKFSQKSQAILKTLARIAMILGHVLWPPNDDS